MTSVDVRHAVEDDLRNVKELLAQSIRTAPRPRRSAGGYGDRQRDRRICRI